MRFKKDTPPYQYEIVREAGENVMYVNYVGASESPSISGSAKCMAQAVNLLTEAPNIARLIFVQNKNYSYDFSQISLLVEVSQLYTYLTKQEKILEPRKIISTRCSKCFPQREKLIKGLILGLLKKDPIGCYVESKRFLREEKINSGRFPKSCSSCEKRFVKLLEKISDFLSKLKLNQKINLDGHHIGNRDIYSSFFRPDIIPNFAFTRLDSKIPKGAKLIDEYKLIGEHEKSSVTIMKIPGKAKYLYQLNPAEFSLKEEFYELVNLARDVMIEHTPKAEEFTDPQRTRQIFFNIARDLLQELSKTRKVKLSYNELNELATILVRHTIGFGLVEVLLLDPKLQDISVNSPISHTPIFVRHQDYDECVTNIIPALEDGDSWAAKFRMLSGRPLDEANPILDTDLALKDIRARVAIIQQPLSPTGLSYAFRRHREKPWTLPLFIKAGMLNPLAAGLLSFIIDGSRTFLVAGTRSAGKTSLLSSLLLEIMPKLRIICVEDTLELPVDSIRKLGYDILRMKVRAAMLKATTEVEASEGIRTSLRLGDSCLIIGEVRSEEAKALYESMRIGALANVVAGTIHGASPYGVFDRVVNDLNVPVTSFKATDIIVVCNPIKSADGMHFWRRVTQISEVRKNWSKDPLEENGFVDLMKYNVEKDELEPTSDLINGESEILKDIASNVKGWAGNWDAVWDNVLLRAKIKEEIVKQADKNKMPELLEAEFITKSNNIFHAISDKVTKEKSIPESKSVFPEFQEWMREEIKAMKE